MKRKQERNSFGVIGLGRFGTALAITLANAGKEVIVVDRNESKVKELRQYTDYAFVAEELNADTLREIGIQNCDVAIVCIGEKMDTSILTTMCVVEMGVPTVIAKALTAEQGAVLEKLGAQVVYPERDMALRLGKKLVSPNFLDYVSLDNSIEIRQIIVADSLVGKSVEECGIRRKYKLNIIAIENEHETTIEVMPDYRLGEGDVIVVIGKISNIDRFEKDN
jgi:trk system potassium uptake protein TrkA